MTPEQLDAYDTHLRIQEITQQLCLTQDDPPELHNETRNRSPSPPPEYDSSGRRTNTRQARRRQRLEQERNRFVTTASKTFAHYQAPCDIRANLSSSSIKDKVYIPARDFPGLNFIGQILGPRDHSLRQMMEESQANIAIRGKGSVKQVRGRRAQTTTTDDDLQEPLHCLITADEREKVASAKELTNRVIETIISTPEDQNVPERAQT